MVYFFVQRLLSIFILPAFTFSRNYTKVLFFKEKENYDTFV